MPYWQYLFYTSPVAMMMTTISYLNIRCCMTKKWMTTSNQSRLVARFENDLRKNMNNTKIIIMKSHPVARFAQERKF